MWPFRSREHKPSRDAEIERLQTAVSTDRTELYKNLIRLDHATKAIETEGVRGMLGEMFQRLEKGKNRD